MRDLRHRGCVTLYLMTVEGLVEEPHNQVLVRSRHAVSVGGLSGAFHQCGRSGRDAGERLGTDPDVDELELLYPRVGRHLGEPGRGEHSVDGGFEALVVEALPVLL